jgi:hypothetical protein
MPRYALSLAHIVKVQFSDSKALPHGRAGAAALLQELDLGKTLLLSGVDLEAMQDPKQLPTWAGAAGVRVQASSFETLASSCLIDAAAVLTATCPATLPLFAYCSF